MLGLLGLRRSSHDRVRSVLPLHVSVDQPGADDSIKREKQPQLMGERLIVVKAKSSQHVLTGRTLLASATGRQLMGLRWPFALVVICGCSATAILQTGILSELHTCRGIGGHKVLIPVLQPLGHALEAVGGLCFLLEIVLLMHVVHTRLLQLTLHSFDHWVIMLCMLRAKASYLCSRARLLGVGLMWSHDTGSVIICVERTILMVLLEAAELQRKDKVVLLVVNLLFCTMLLLPTILPPQHGEAEHWDPSAMVDIWWLAPMTPQSQFISALISAHIYIGKALLNFAVRGNSFMFLRAQFELEVNRLDELYRQLDFDSDGRVSLLDWQLSLVGLGIPPDQLQAGFKMLDVGASGSITFEAFQRFMRGRCEANPSRSHTWHLTLFCREALIASSQTAPLLRMIDAVLDQWQRVQLKGVSQGLYRWLQRIEGIGQLFHGMDIEGQASMFSIFVSTAIQWLGQRNFLRLESDVLQLGMRHARYGLRMSMLSTFQLGLFSSLRDQLGTAFLEHEWAFIWMHFITRPFLTGLARGLRIDRQGLLQCALSSSFAATLDTVMAEVGQQIADLCPGRSDLFTRPGHTSAVAGMLSKSCRDLAEGREEDARATVRAVAEAHACSKVSAFDLALFLEAFLGALRKQHCFDEDRVGSGCMAWSAWTWIVQVEVIDGFLMAPFAAVEDTLRSIEVDTTQVLDEQSWLLIMRRLGVPDDTARPAFFELSADADVQITFELARATILSETMSSPDQACDQVMRDWCRKQSRSSSPSRASAGSGSFPQCRQCRAQELD